MFYTEKIFSPILEPIPGMAKSFSEHGSFSLHISGNILVAHVADSWNKECAQLFSQQFKLQVKPLLGEDWGHLVYLDDWELGVPEIEPIIHDLVAWSIKNGLKCSANIFSESMAKKYFLDKMIVEKIGDFEKQTFTEEQAAINWLTSCGYTL